MLACRLILSCIQNLKSFRYMATSKTQRRMAWRQKLLVMRIHAKSKASNSSISRGMVLYNNCMLIKLQLEALQKQYLNLIQQVQEVKIAKVGKGLILVRVNCVKIGRDLLVSILEVFEKMGLNVFHVRISCKHNIFGMEAIVEALDYDDDQDSEFRELTKAILKAIHIRSDDVVVM